MRGEQRRERAQAELEPVRLRLVAAEQEHRAAVGRLGRGREALDVDGVRQDLPAPGRLAEELVRGASCRTRSGRARDRRRAAPGEEDG